MGGALQPVMAKMDGLSFVIIKIAGKGRQVPASRERNKMMTDM
jgi:hypothetical protein